MLKRRELAALGLGASMLFAGGALAADVTWTGAFDTDFGNYRNWSPNQVPGSSDKAIIANVTTDPVMTQDEEIQGLEVQDGGWLRTDDHKLTINGASTMDVQTGGELEVERNGALWLTGGGAAHVVDGLLELEGSGATLRIEGLDVDILGGGYINGLDDAAQIQIDADVEFASYVEIHGGMVIKGDVAVGGETDNGTFYNFGTVRADSALTLKMHADTPFDDDASALWEARETNSVLFFDREQTNLEGDFQIDRSLDASPGCPKLRFDVDITTDGVLLPFAAFRKGCVDVNSATFTFSSDTITSDTGYGGCSCP